MQIGVPKELLDNETRVAATPKTVEQLIKFGFDVAIEAAAGKLASFNDSAYVEAGAQIVDTAAVWQSDLIFKVNAPTDAEIALIKEGATLVSFLWPAQNPELVEKLSQKNINVMAMDMVPRISRAQSLDALSSMANIAGYRAVVEAANQFGRFFTGQITAAGKVPPAKVFVIGAGVAGLAAIGAAGSMGAIVRATDTRPEVADQIESMGGEFVQPDYQEDGSSTDGYAKVMSEGYLKAQSDLVAAQAKDVDIIITTALIPGRPAPKLITAEMVQSMRPGSVIVDLAAQTGGNCELTEPGKVVVKHDVTIIGYSDLPARLPGQSSQLYGTNLVNLIKLLCKEKDGNIDIDFEDEVLRNMTVVRAGEVTFPPPKISVSVAPQAAASAAPKAVVEKKPTSPWVKFGVMAGAGLVFAALSAVAPASFLQHLVVFVLACIVGYYVVWNVSHSLHTPLMSVTNAISGIIVVGALVQIGIDHGAVKVLAFIAILIASINIAGGFTVTRRMLKMFHK